MTNPVSGMEEHGKSKGNAGRMGRQSGRQCVYILFIIHFDCNMIENCTIILTSKTIININITHINIRMMMMIIITIIIIIKNTSSK
jgi:hypothetical protein